MEKNLEHPIFQLISETAEEKHVEVYVIGGYVRDLILERPSKDIDIVVLGNGIDIAKAVATKANNAFVSVFKTFGTAMFRYKGTEIEFVGARKESYNRDSRKPVVEEGSLEDDQKRRDLTINALAISLNKANYGEILDPFDGIKHIHERLIKTPLNPEITFDDDPLRMIRAIRFACQLNFVIENSTFEAIKKYKDRISIVSMERIIDEFNKIMMSATPSKGIRLLDESGLLNTFFPELCALKGVDSINGIKHKDNFNHTMQVLDGLALYSDNLWLRWAALLHDIGKPKTKRFVEGQGWTFYAHNIVSEKMTRKIFNRLKLPQNEKMKFVTKMVNLHMRPIVLSEDVVTDSAIRRLLFDAGDDIDNLMTLAEADITSKNEIKVKKFLNNFKIVRQKLKDVEEKDQIRNFQPPISGEEIMTTFDIPPCSTIGIIKSAIKDAILDGIISNNHEDAFAFMLQKAEELGIKPTKKELKLLPKE